MKPLLGLLMLGSAAYYFLNRDSDTEAMPIVTAGDYMVTAVKRDGLVRWSLFFKNSAVAAGESKPNEYQADINNAMQRHRESVGAS